MLLAGKNAVVYGAGGAVGGAVARAFAQEGARVVLAGRTREPLDVLAESIRAMGGVAEVAVVDATDRSAVERVLDELEAGTGGIDISFSAVGLQDIQGTGFLELATDDFLQPVEIAMRAHFITGTEAAKRMRARRAGVIMTITARPDLGGHANCGGFGVACAAIESLYRTFAIEFGADGIRSLVIRSSGSPDSPGVEEVFGLHAGNEGVSSDTFTEHMGAGTLLKRLPLLAEVANAAVLMASDRASAMTAVIANVTCGEWRD